MLIVQKGFRKAICEKIVGRERIKIKKQLYRKSKNIGSGIGTERRRELSFFKEGDVVISRDDNSLPKELEILLFFVRY